MSPALHRPHLAETRHTHGFGGPAPTPPPGPPCDQCGKGTSRYNPHGRCNAWCEKQREVEFGGLRVKACMINYELECMSCQKHGNTYARDHFNRQKEAA